jgi:thiosulfate dehydrogenase [quinone] large subunit
MFFWAFIDKSFGLGFATKSANAWISGGSPTTGFLMSATKGPFGEVFKSLAGVALVDWLFMIGLLFVGTSLLLNRRVFWGGMVGILMMVLMYFATLWPVNNPIIDDHIIYSLALGLIALRSRYS